MLLFCTSRSLAGWEPVGGGPGNDFVGSSVGAVDDATEADDTDTDGTGTDRAETDDTGANGADADGTDADDGAAFVEGASPLTNEATDFDGVAVLDAVVDIPGVVDVAGVADVTDVASDDGALVRGAGDNDVEVVSGLAPCSLPDEGDFFAAAASFGGWLALGVGWGIRSWSESESIMRRSTDC